MGRRVMNQVIMGIDPSLNGTGLYIGGPNRTGQDLTIRTPSTDVPTAGRLSSLRDQLSFFIQDHNPDLAVIESPAFSKFSQNDVMAGVHWIARECLWASNVRVAEVSPARLKKFATGNGRADKKPVRLAASTAASRKFPNQDAAEAFVLWCIGMHLCRKRHPFEPMAPAQHDAVADIRWGPVPSSMNALKPVIDFGS